MKVRPATGKDLEAIVAMIQHFSDELPHKQFVDPDVDSILATVTGLMTNPLGQVYVAHKDDGEVVGTAGCMIFPLWFNHNHITGSTLFWYVQPEHRRSKAGKLLAKIIESWSKEQGGHSYVFNSLANKHQKRMNNIYLNKGYTPIETTFIKEL